VRLDVDPMQRARHRPVVRCRLVQRKVQASPQARRVGRLLALVGIATLSVAIWAVAARGSWGGSKWNDVTGPTAGGGSATPLAT